MRKSRFVRYAGIYCAGVLTGMLIGGIAMLDAKPMHEGATAKYKFEQKPRYAVQTADFKSERRYNIWCDETVGGTKECGGGGQIYPETVQIPEPSTALLMLAGFVGLLMRARK